MNSEDKLDQPPTHAKAHITQGNGVHNRNFPLYRVNDGHFTSFRAARFPPARRDHLAWRFFLKLPSSMQRCTQCNAGALGAYVSLF